MSIYSFVVYAGEYHVIVTEIPANREGKMGLPAFPKHYYGFGQLPGKFDYAKAPRFYTWTETEARRRAMALEWMSPEECMAFELEGAARGKAL